MSLPVAEPACRVCAMPARPGFALCYCCDTLLRQLRLPLAPVVVVSNYRIGDPMHRRLRGYKDSLVPEARLTYTASLAGLVTRWMATNRDHLSRRFGTGWDLVTAVPSTHRPATAPVDTLIALVPELARCHERVLRRGPETVDHLRAARKGFVIDRSIERTWLARRSVLVLDDTITTGARAQSAAAALWLGGARVAGVVAVGRAVRGAGHGRPDPMGLAVA